METQSKTALFASEDGRFACRAHTPHVGSGTWYAERWAAATPAEIRDFRREIGRDPTCETCAAIERNGAPQ